MRRIAPVARKRSLAEARKGERAEWLRLSPEERWQAVEEMRRAWCRGRNPPCELGKVAAVAKKHRLHRPTRRRRTRRRRESHR